jgi:DNA-binding GntR family transcriptional regulator
LAAVSRLEAGGRQSLTRQAYAMIKERILSNALAPGYQALEAEVADDLCMSRTPVREALIRLEAEGLVELKPRHGMRVLPVSPDDMREIYQILTALETAAVGLIAGQHQRADALADLREACDRMDRCLAEDDLDGWADADEAFHGALVTHCGNRRLADVCLTFREQTHRARLITLRLRPKPYASAADHRALLAAIERGDVSAARDLHLRHRTWGSELMVDTLVRYNLTSL